MVVFNKKIDLERVDFSFVPSLRCNLKCSFCSYSAGPANELRLDVDQARRFIGTVDWNRISSWGFYGGEVSIETALYQKFIDLVPETVPKFTITNGAWSTDPGRADDFFRFVDANRLFVVVSGTEEHKRHQDPELMAMLDGVAGIHLKGDDEIHPMGRSARRPWSCSYKCLTHPQPIRLGMFPGGHIFLQNCDGVYPFVGGHRSKFRDVFARAVSIRRFGCRPGQARNINDILGRRYE